MTEKRKSNLSAPLDFGIILYVGIFYGALRKIEIGLCFKLQKWASTINIFSLFITEISTFFFNPALSSRTIHACTKKMLSKANPHP